MHVTTIQDAGEYKDACAALKELEMAVISAKATYAHLIAAARIEPMLTLDDRAFLDDIADLEAQRSGLKDACDAWEGRNDDTDASLSAWHSGRVGVDFGR